MSYVKGLRCRECGAETPIVPLHVCETCFGPFEVVYDYPAIRRVTTREAIAARPLNLWRYRELLPILRTRKEAKDVAGAEPRRPDEACDALERCRAKLADSPTGARIPACA